MKTSLQLVLALIVVVLGIVLMTGGIWTSKHGATVGGVIISGVAAQRFIALRKKARSRAD